MSLDAYENDEEATRKGRCAWCEGDKALVADGICADCCIPPKAPERPRYFVVLPGYYSPATDRWYGEQVLQFVQRDKAELVAGKFGLRVETIA